MLVDLVGYDFVKYTKDGEERSFAKLYCLEASESGKIAVGRRVWEVITSEKYLSKLLDAEKDNKSLHIGWGKDRRSFLYVK